MSLSDIQTHPKKVQSDFNGQKIATIAAGDEFSLVIDERGTPWTWGRSDHGQVSQGHLKSLDGRFLI